MEASALTTRNDGVLKRCISFARRRLLRQRRSYWTYVHLLSLESSTDQTQHAFLGSWKKEKLKGLVSFVTTWTKQSYRYLGGQDENVNQRWKEDSQSWQIPSNQ